MCCKYIFVFSYSQLTTIFKDAFRISVKSQETVLKKYVDTKFHETVKKLCKEDRKKFVTKNKLCVHCLESGHSVSKCTLNPGQKCNVFGCKSLHHPLLHGAKVLNLKPEKEVCGNCGSCNHVIFSCNSFLKYEIEQRKMTCQEKNICFTCLAPGHGSDECLLNFKSKIGSKNCESFHHPLLRNAEIAIAKCVHCGQKETVHASEDCPQFYARRWIFISIVIKKTFVIWIITSRFGTLCNFLPIGMNFI